MLRITLSRLGSPEHVIDLRDRTLRIGRGAGNEVLLKDPDKTVSRTHGEVRREAVGWVFIDNDSQNGSWIEGRRVDRVVLRDGVSVSFGDYELTCQETAGQEDTAARAAAVPAAGAAVLGPEDYTQSASAPTAAVPPPAPPAEPAGPETVAFDQLPTVMLSPEAPADETPPLPPPAARRAEAPVDPSDLPAVFEPADVRPAAAAGEHDEEDADAKTIIVPADAGAPMAGVAAAPPAEGHDDFDADAATIVVPSMPASPPTAPVPVQPAPPVAPPSSWFDAAQAGDRPTVLAAPTPVFPIVPGPEADATMALPGDLSALFRNQGGGAGPVPGASTAQLPQVPAPEAPAVGEDVATVLIPGRPPTGQQLVSPPRPSGERPLPPVTPPPASPSAAPTGWTPAPPASTAPPFSPPVLEPPAVPTPSPFVAPTFDAPPAAPAVPAPITGQVAAPVTSVGSPQMAPATPVPPPPATPAATVPTPPLSAPRPASSMSAVLVWGVAWLALFGLIAAGIWIWMSSRAPAGEPPAETAAPAAAPAEAPPATPSVPVPAEAAPPGTGAPAEGAVTVPATTATTVPPPAAEPPPPAATAPAPPPVRAAPPPDVWVDRPPPGSGAAAGAVPRREGERPAEYRERVAAIERQYVAGRDALAARRPVEARDLLRGVAAAAPAYKDVSGLLADAEAAVRREGAAAFAGGERLEQAREFEKALAAYGRAQQLGAPPDEVAAATQRVQQAMRAIGEKAFADAKQFDGLARNADAARLYEVAVRYLPEGDPRRAQARQRLEALAVRRP